MGRKKVAIIYGGKSVEHQVSINSASNIYQYIDKERFEPILLGVSKSGTWYHCTNTSDPIDGGIPLRTNLDSPGYLSTVEQTVFIDIAFVKTSEPGSRNVMLRQ